MGSDHHMPDLIRKIAVRYNLSLQILQYQNSKTKNLNKFFYNFKNQQTLNTYVPKIFFGRKIRQWRFTRCLVCCVLYNNCVLVIQSISGSGSGTVKIMGEKCVKLLNELFNYPTRGASQIE